MAKQETNNVWTELTDIWMNSSQTKKINFEITELIVELKSKVSQFEKDSIKSDLGKVEESWSQFKDNISEFEKRSIEKDVTKINTWLRKILNLFKKKS